MARRTSIEQVSDTVLRADKEVDDLVSPYRETPLVRAVGWLSQAGDQLQLRTLSGATIAAGLLLGNSRLTRAGTRMFLAHELATLAKGVVKGNVDRTRPRNATSMRQRKIRRGHSSATKESSFPSGHTAGALAVARAFSREFPEHRAVAVTAASAIALAQAPRCAHYVSDIAGGAVIGLAAEEVSDEIWDALPRG